MTNVLAVQERNIRNVARDEMDKPTPITMPYHNITMPYHNHYARNPDPNIKPVRSKNTPRIGRNDKCPCGSGKKYKKCCGN